MASSSKFPLALLVVVVRMALLLQQAHGRDDDLVESSSAAAAATVVPHIKMVNKQQNSSGNEYGDCHYEVEVRTSNYDGSGSDSTMWFDLYDKYGNGVHFSQNGAAERFERATIDYISTDGPCIEPCNLVVTSDGTGEYPDWCCDYVQVVASSATSFSQILFYVDQCIGPGKPTMQFQRWYC